MLSAMYNGHVFLWNYNTQSLVKSATPLSPKIMSNFNQQATNSIQACDQSNSNDLQNAYPSSIL